MTLPDKRIILIADNARYHHFKGIQEYLGNIGNINVLYLPKYCSELNSIELLWRHLKANITNNTLFAIFDELIQKAIDFLNDLKSNAAKIRKLCPFIA